MPIVIRLALALALATLLAAPPAFAAEPAAAAAPAEKRKARGKERTAELPHGRPGDPRKARRVVRIELSDTMRFFPSQIHVKRGDTVRFDLRNSGELPHEMVIGTMDELKARAALMKHVTTNGVAHDVDHGEHGVRVAPGDRGTLTWHFTRPGEFHYGCLLPGRFEAGMIGTIVVR